MQSVCVVVSNLNLSSIYTHFNTLKKKNFRKTLWKKVKLLKMSNFTFFHNVFYAICILKSFNSHISVVVNSFFEFGTVSKWCNREWVKFGAIPVNFSYFLEIPLNKLDSKRLSLKHSVSSLPSITSSSNPDLKKKPTLQYICQIFFKLFSRQENF